MRWWRIFICSVQFVFASALSFLSFFFFTPCFIFIQFLQKMLEDRCPSVRSLQESGKQLLKSLDPKDKKNHEKQLTNFMQRWNTLSDNAQKRQLVLENVTGIAKQFQETQEPLLEWLEGAEKKLASLANTIPTNNDDLIKRRDSLKVCGCQLGIVGVIIWSPKTMVWWSSKTSPFWKDCNCWIKFTCFMREEKILSKDDIVRNS